MPTLQLFASFAYLLTSIMCLRAMCAARTRRLEANCWWFWLAIGILFALLIVSRVLEIEGHLHAIMRRFLIDQQAYTARRAIQGIAAVVVLLTFIAVGLLVFRLKELGHGMTAPAVRWAALGAIIMVGLIMLRVVSFHTMDAILFGGPHLNMFIDPGATAMVGLAAHAYVESAKRQARW